MSDLEMEQDEEGFEGDEEGFNSEVYLLYCVKIANFSSLKVRFCQICLIMSSNIELREIIGKLVIPAERLQVKASCEFSSYNSMQTTL